MKNRGGVALLAGRFTGGEADFPLGHGQPGDTVADQQDVFALIAEELGGGQSHREGADAERGWAVRRCDDDDRALQAFLAEFVLDEVADPAVALSN